MGLSDKDRTEKVIIIYANILCFQGNYKYFLLPFSGCFLPTEDPTTKIDNETWLTTSIASPGNWLEGDWTLIIYQTINHFLPFCPLFFSPPTQYNRKRQK